jgi:hypothetical protein
MRSIVLSSSVIAFTLVLSQGVLAQTAEPSPAPAAEPAPAAPPAEPSYVVPPPSTLLEPQSTLPPGQPAPVDDYSTYESPRDASMKGRMSGFIAYDFAIPLGTVRDFTENVSPLGLELQFRGWLLSNLSLGITGEWSTFLDDRPRTTYQVENGAVTADAYNYMITTNVRFLAHYYFMDSGKFRPYIGPHIGMGWSSFQSEAADLVLSDTQFSVAFGGDLGAIIVPSPELLVLANVRYSSQPASEFLNLVDNVQTISMQVGVGL